MEENNNNENSQHKPYSTSNINSAQVSRSNSNSTSYLTKNNSQVENTKKNTNKNVDEIANIYKNNNNTNKNKNSNSYNSSIASSRVSSQNEIKKIVPTNADQYTNYVKANTEGRNRRRNLNINQRNPNASVARNTKPKGTKTLPNSRTPSFNRAKTADKVRRKKTFIDDDRASTALGHRKLKPTNSNPDSKTANNINTSKFSLSNNTINTNQKHPPTHVNDKSKNFKSNMAIDDNTCTSNKNTTHTDRPNINNNMSESRLRNRSKRQLPSKQGAVRDKDREKLHSNSTENSSIDQSRSQHRSKTRSKSRPNRRQGDKLSLANGTLSRGPTANERYISTLGQNIFKVKFIRSGDFHQEGLTVAVSSERFTNFDDLINYLNRRLTTDAENIRSSASYLPKGVRSIYLVCFVVKETPKTSPTNQTSNDDSVPKSSKTLPAASYISNHSNVAYYKIQNLDDFITFETNLILQNKEKYYLCTSTTGGKPTTTDKRTCKIMLSKKRQKISRPNFVLNIGKNENDSANGDISLRSHLFMRNAQMNRDFVQPRHIHVIKPGQRPRTIKKFLLNMKTVHSFEQVLDDINDRIQLETGAIYKVYNLAGERVTALNQFFLEHKIFLVYGNRTINDIFHHQHTVLDEIEHGTINNVNLQTMNQGLPKQNDRRNGIRPPRTAPSRNKNPESRGRSKQPKRTSQPKVRRNSSLGHQSVTASSKKITKPSKRSKSVKPATTVKCLSADLPPCIYDNYDLIEMIGIGNFAEVQKARKKGDPNNKANLAVKIIDKSKRLSDEHEILNEAIMLKSISESPHPNIIHLYEFFDMDDRIYLVLDYVSGGDLFDVIAKGPKFNEMECVHLLLDLLRATRFLHSHKICHRDIKPENCLLYYLPNPYGDSNQQPSGRKDILQATLKLTDFGLATKLMDNDPLRMVCGSPTYVAPEIIYQDEEGYDLAVDIWAVGVISYILLCEKPPFISTDGSQDSLFDAILSGNYVFPNNAGRERPISNTAVNFVGMLLQVEPHRRMTAYEALQHEWITRNRKLFENQGRGNKQLNGQAITNGRSSSEASTGVNSASLKSQISQPSERFGQTAENEIENLLNNLEDNIQDDEFNKSGNQQGGKAIEIDQNDQKLIQALNGQKSVGIDSDVLCESASPQQQGVTRVQEEVLHTADGPLIIHTKIEYEASTEEEPEVDDDDIDTNEEPDKLEQQIQAQLLTQETESFSQAEGQELIDFDTSISPTNNTATFTSPIDPIEVDLMQSITNTPAMVNSGTLIVDLEENVMTSKQEDECKRNDQMNVEDEIETSNLQIDDKNLQKEISQITTDLPESIMPNEEVENTNLKDSFTETESINDSHSDTATPELPLEIELKSSSCIEKTELPNEITSDLEIENGNDENGNFIGLIFVFFGNEIDVNLVDMIIDISIKKTFFIDVLTLHQPKQATNSDLIVSTLNHNEDDNTDHTSSTISNSPSIVSLQPSMVFNSGE